MDKSLLGRERHSAKITISKRGETYKRVSKSRGENEAHALRQKEAALKMGEPGQASKTAEDPGWVGGGEENSGRGSKAGNKKGHQEVSVATERRGKIVNGER